MPKRRIYTVELIPEAEGGFTVRVPALPEVVTFGATKPEALSNAARLLNSCWKYALPRRTDSDDVVPVLEKLTVAA